MVNTVVVDVVDMKLLMIFTLGNVKYDFGINES